MTTVKEARKAIFKVVEPAYHNEGSLAEPDVKSALDAKIVEHLISVLTRPMNPHHPYFPEISNEAGESYETLWCYAKGRVWAEVTTSHLFLELGRGNEVKHFLSNSIVRLMVSLRINSAK